MPSLRGRLFVWILRHRHLLRLKRRPETERDWATDLAGVRRAAEASAGMLGRLPRDVAAEPVDAGGVAAEWLRPATARTDAGAVLYFHGGGYVLGSVAAHRAIVAKFVRGGAVPALVFDYRLAPEHPFPAGLHDALAAYDWLLAQGVPPGRVVFAGDSAGGGLLLAAMLALKDRGSPLPGAGVALSPWTDLTFSGASYRTNAPLCLAPTGSWRACRGHYLGERDPRDPYASPLHGNLAGLPPLLLFAGGDETLRDDAVAFADKARAAGVDVSLRLGQGLFHCYPACAPLFPEATAAMEEIRAFISRFAG